MDKIATGLTRIFDLLFAPFGAAGWPALVVISLLSGVLLLWLFKLTSRQGVLAERRRVLTGHLFELGLYQDDLHVMGRIQWDLFKANLRYLSASLPSLLVLLPAVLVIVVQLDARYHRRPLQAGETMLVSATVAEGREEALGELGLRPGRNMVVEAGPLVDRVGREVWWRVRAETDQVRDLRITHGDEAWLKSLHPDASRGHVAGARERGGWHHLLLNPTDTALPGDAPVTAIAVDLPRRDTDWAGLPVWLWTFFGVSILGGLAVKRWIKVEM